MINIAKHTKVDMIWVAGRSPTLVSHSLRGVATNLKATTLAYLAIDCIRDASLSTKAMKPIDKALLIAGQPSDHSLSFNRHANSFRL